MKIRDAFLVALPLLATTPLVAQNDCAVQTIACGETKNGSLSAQDCPFGDGTFFDFYTFSGAAGFEVTTTMTSTAIDGVLILENPAGETVATDDDSAGGVNARIVYQLTAAGNWAIIANTEAAAQTGPYSLSLTCEAPPLPDGAFLTTPELPNFRFKVRINDTFAGVKEGNCPSETLCISGAISGRSEIFVRIVGPKPNGFLWPNLIKFSTSKVEVWIQQVSTGVVKYYQLPGANAASSELPGLFDRTGFRP